MSDDYLQAHVINGLASLVKKSPEIHAHLAQVYNLVFLFDIKNIFNGLGLLLCVVPVHVSSIHVQLLILDACG